MEKLHGSGRIDEAESINICLSDKQEDTLSVAEIISNAGSNDYHRSLSWL